MLRIATWNVEYADTAPTNDRRRAIMDANSADIWVLTETHDQLSPSASYFAVHAEQRPLYGRRVRSGSRWVSIWSRFPLTRLHIDGADTERTAVARAETPFGPLIVYGTVMPWQGDKGCMGMRDNAKGWSEFYRVVPGQIAEWDALEKAHPESALCVAGDFNVDLASGEYYGSKEAISLVRSGLDRCALFCPTEPARLPVGLLTHPPIDHIALPKAWEGRVAVVGAWEGDVGSPRLSDHSGMVVEITPA